jgi:putative ABC transport system permease protein
MFRHLFKLIWKRKGRNLMLSLEILIAFVIVFAIAAFGLRSYQLVQMPTGFDSEDVWAVSIGNAGSWGSPLPAGSYDRLKQGLLALPGAQQVAFVSSAPYEDSNFSTSFKSSSGRSVRTEIVYASDDFLDLLRIKVVQGRAFGPLDNGAAAAPVVINRRMALEMFGTTDVIGKQFEAGGPDQKNEARRIVGLIDDYRKKGELDPPRNVVIKRQAGESQDNPRSILIRMAPGTPRSFEETLNGRLKLINNQWSYQIEPLAASRITAMKSRMTPLIIVSIVAAFLLLMVAFGLFGVLWQNTTRRVPEIGLRRAIGANAGDIYRQIIAEQFLLSSGAMLVALLLLVQLPLTGALGEMLNWTVFAAATVVSMAAIYLLSLLCSVYPGWRASRLSPTEALHYE